MPGFRHPLTLATALAFTAGFVDVAGFIALLSLFTAHVTGNFVLIGAAIAKQTHHGLVAKLLALPMFVVAVAITRLVAVALERRGVDPLTPLILAQMVFLAGFLGLGLAARPIEDPESLLTVLAAMAAVTAMGIQNAAARTLLASLPPTTIMTGNTTQVVIDLVDLARGDPELAGPARRRLGQMLPILLAFALGTILGALGYAWWSFWCLMAPIAVLATVPLTARRQVAA